MRNSAIKAGMFALMLVFPLTSQADVIHNQDNSVPGQANPSARTRPTDSQRTIERERMNNSLMEQRNDALERRNDLRDRRDEMMNRRGEMMENRNEMNNRRLERNSDTLEDMSDEMQRDVDEAADRVGRTLNNPEHSPYLPESNRGATVNNYMERERY